MRYGALDGRRCQSLPQYRTKVRHLRPDVPLRREVRDVQIINATPSNVGEIPLDE